MSAIKCQVFGLLMDLVATVETLFNFMVLNFNFYYLFYILAPQIQLDKEQEQRYQFTKEKQCKGTADIDGFIQSFIPSFSFVFLNYDYIFRFPVSSVFLLHNLKNSI